MCRNIRWSNTSFMNGHLHDDNPSQANLILCHRKCASVQCMNVEHGSFAAMHLDLCNSARAHSLIEAVRAYQSRTHDDSKSWFAPIPEMALQIPIELLGMPLATMRGIHSDRKQFRLRDDGGNFGKSIRL